MAKTFDATLKGMLEESPGDWPVLAGLPHAEAEVIDADVSTFTGAADKVLRVSGRTGLDHAPGISVGAGCQSAAADADGQRPAGRRHGLMVRSVAILLRPEANLSNLTGEYERHFAGEEAHLTFRYQVIRVWQLPPEPLLSGGLGLLPLAPISAVTEAELPAVMKRMKERLGKPKARSLARRVWAATYILLGMRYSMALADRLLEDAMIWEHSATYQGLLQKGRLEEARKNLLAAGG